MWLRRGRQESWRETLLLVGEPLVFIRADKTVQGHLASACADRLGPSVRPPDS